MPIQSNAVNSFDPRFNINNSADNIALIAPEEVVNFFHNIVDSDSDTDDSAIINRHGKDIDSRSILQNRVDTRLQKLFINGVDEGPFTVDDYIDAITAGYGDSR